MQEQVTSVEGAECVAVGLQLGMKRKHGLVVPRVRALAKGMACGEDGGVMDRRTFLAGTGATLATGVVAKRFSFARKLGVSSASFAIRNRFSRAAQTPPGVAVFDGPVGFLEHCHRLQTVGVQISVRGWSERGLGKKLRAKAEALGMYLEGQISLPRTEADVERFDAEVAAAKEIGVTILRTVMLGGRRYENFNSAADWAAFGKSSWQRLTWAEPVAKKHGVKLALENHKDWRIDEMLAILKRISSKHVGVNLDTGNNLALLEDPHAVVEALAPHTITTHLKDMAVQEYEQGFLLSEVPLGEGFLDLKRIVATCEKANPHVRHNLEMITRNPLKVPCLTQRYWKTFGQRPVQDLIAALDRVRSNKPTAPLPSIAGKSPAEQVAYEQAHNARSVAYAHGHLKI